MSISKTRSRMISDLAGGGVAAPTYKSGNWVFPPGIWPRDSADPAITASANTVFFIPFQANQSFTMKSMACFIVATAVGNVQFALYASDATTGKPTGSALASTASVSTNTGGNTTVSFGATVNLTAGTIYYLAVNFSAAPTFRGLSPVNFLPSGIGDANINNIFQANTSWGAYDISQTFGTWPSVTSASFSTASVLSAPFLMYQIN